MKARNMVGTCITTSLPITEVKKTIGGFRNASSNTVPYLGGNV